MNRLSPEMIRDGMRRLKLVPIQGVFAEFAQDDEISHCCGLTAAILIREEAGPRTRDWTIDDDDAVPDELNARRYAAALDISPSYARGYIRGWDGQPAAIDKDHPEYRDEYFQGVQDGSDAWDLANPLRFSKE